MQQVGDDELVHSLADSGGQAICPGLQVTKREYPRKANSKSVRGEIEGSKPNFWY